MKKPAQHIDPLKTKFELPESLTGRLASLGVVFTQQSAAAAATQAQMQATVEGFLADKRIPKNASWHITPDFRIVFFTENEPEKGGG